MLTICVYRGETTVVYSLFSSVGFMTLRKGFLVLGETGQDLCLLGKSEEDLWPSGKTKMGFMVFN